MKKLTILLLCLTTTNFAFAAEKAPQKCSKKSIEVSCADVKDAKREFFCAKKKTKITEAKRKKFCLKAKKKKVSKKKV